MSICGGCVRKATRTGFDSPRLQVVGQVGLVVTLGCW